MALGARDLSNGTFTDKTIVTHFYSHSKSPHHSMAQYVGNGRGGGGAVVTDNGSIGSCSRSPSKLSAGTTLPFAQHRNFGPTVLELRKQNKKNKCKRHSNGAHPIRVQFVVPFLPRNRVGTAFECPVGKPHFRNT